MILLIEPAREPAREAAGRAAGATPKGAARAAIEGGWGRYTGGVPIARNLPLPAKFPPVELASAEAVAELFERAAEVNLSHPGRRGAMALPRAGMDLQGGPEGRITLSGDLHDHTLNLHRLVKLTALHRKPHNHLVVQEVAHGEQLVNGHDVSVRTLARVASLIVAYPGRVHHLLSNHELAHLTGEGILKDGVNTVARFDRGVEQLFGEEAPIVQGALKGYIRSLPLAVKTHQGFIACHSLPSPHALADFDPSVLERVPTEADLARGGSAHRMVWGRNATEASAKTLAQAWGAAGFVIGHEKAEMGWDQPCPGVIVLASDHDHGMALRLDLGRRYRFEQLPDLIEPLAAVRLDP